MVFLFQGQNQGTRTTTLATRKEREAAATVLFHPDFNRRLRNRTESADPSSRGDAKGGRRSRAWAFALTAGGDFHPALRTSAGPGWNGLVWNYKASIPAGKARDTPKWHVPMPEKSNLDTEKCGETGPAGSLTNCKGESDSDLFSSVNF